MYSDIPRSSDRAYSHVEIKQVIDFSDHRVKAPFLVLASTGIRAGFLRQIKIKHLEDKGDIYKLKVYPGEDEEYFTFTTPECRLPSISIWTLGKGMVNQLQLRVICSSGNIITCEGSDPGLLLNVH